MQLNDNGSTSGNDYHNHLLWLTITGDNRGNCWEKNYRKKPLVHKSKI